MITFIKTLFFIALIIIFPSWKDKKKSPSIQTKRQILRTPLSSDVMSLDPRKYTDMLSQSVVRSLFAGLTYLDEKLVPQLDLAESYTISQDRKTYTFHLRNSKWSDGSTITAKDFEQSWKSLLLPAFASKHCDALRCIKNGEKVLAKDCSIEEIGIYAPNDKTLIVELEKPEPKFLEILSYSMFYPVHATMRDSELQPTPQMITSGPFRLKNYTFQTAITLEKNPHFFDANNIALEELQFFIISDKQTALFMFEKGELDFICEVTMKIPPNAIPSLKAKKQLHEVIAAGTHFLVINTQKFPMTNPNIRKAFAYAIDRTSIMENILCVDTSTPALGALPKNLKGDRWHPWFRDNDVKKAQECFAKGLEELKITKKEFPTITVFHVGTACPSSLMEAVQQMWARTLGCQVNYQGMDLPIFFDHLDNKTYAMGRVMYFPDSNDPVELLDFFTSKNSETDTTGWGCEKYNEEIKAAKAAIASNNETEKWQHIENAEKIFCDEMPAIPFLNCYASYIKHPYVKRIEVNSIYLINFRKVRIE
jgi:oligopeptide transport system substrate-binding protein